MPEYIQRWPHTTALQGRVWDLRGQTVLSEFFSKGKRIISSQNIRMGYIPMIWGNINGHTSSLHLSLLIL